ncbi:MAG: site-specific DNA-methyltransferase [Polyangiaceae bacterium]
MRAGTQTLRLDWPEKTLTLAADPVHLEVQRAGHPGCMLVQGDNLLAMRALWQRTGSAFSLVYLDPPFLTGRVHNRVDRRRDPETGNVVRLLRPAFDDRWEGLTHYLSALGHRLRVARELLADDGCLVLHVDSKTSHYAKVLCDEVFGPDCFASEIIWRYRRWPSRTKNFQRVHDVLLRYVKSPAVEPKFNQLYEPLAASTLETWGDKKQRAVVGKDGRRLRSSRTEEETRGTPLGDVWEIGIVAPIAKERTGYPTQKPLALLQRLVDACTNPGDLVLDPYCGSGTSLVAALGSGRRAVGIDVGGEAIRVSRKRLRELGYRPFEERVVLDAPGPAKTRDAPRRALAG